MLKSIGKRYLALLLTVLMVVSILPVTAQAAAVSGFNVVGLSTNATSGTWTGNGANLSSTVNGSGGCNNSASSNTSSVTLTNTTGSKARIVFNYNATINREERDSSGSVTINDNTGEYPKTHSSTAVGTYTADIAAGGTVTISLQSPRGNDYSTAIRIQNVTITKLYTITWKNGAETLKTDIVPEGQTPSYSEATPISENGTFVGWGISADSRSPVTVQAATEDKTYYAVFMDESAGDAWIYEEAENSDGWKTTDDYSDLYYYDTNTKQYYPVETTVGDTWVFTATANTSWKYNNDYNVTDYYAFNDNDQKYYIVQKRAGQLYSSAGNEFHPGEKFHENSAQTVGGTKEVYGNTSRGPLYYLYDNDMHVVYFNCMGDGAGGDSGSGIGYYSELYFFPETTEKPNDITVSSGTIMQTLLDNGTIYGLVDGDIIHVRRWGYYHFGTPGVGDGSWIDYFTTPTKYKGTLYNTDGNGVRELYYTRTNGDSVTLGKNVIKGGEIYNKALYTRSAETGVIQLSANDTNFGNVGVNKGDVLWTGKLYRRRIDVMGRLDGEKTLSERQDNGNYNLTIDSWATGPYQGYEDEESAEQQKDKTPLDIVIAVDQSASMRTADLVGEAAPVYSSTGKTSWTLNELRDGTQYYYQVGDKYYPVKLGNGTLYSGTVSVLGNHTFGYGNDGVSLMVNGAPTYYNVRTNYYVYVDADGDGIKEMHRVRGITAGLDLHYGFYPYIYKDENDEYAQMGKWTDNHYWFRVISPWGGNKVRGNSRWNTIVAGGNNDSAARISFIDKDGNLLGASDSAFKNAKMSYSWVTDTAKMNNLYYASSRGYANLYYVDDNGNQQIIGTRFFSDDNFTTKAPLYTVSDGATRVSALESAVQQFVNAVKTEATEEDNTVDHKIAIVGYAQNHKAAATPVPADAKVLNNQTASYANTGVFSGSNLGTFTNYDNSPSYSSALQSVSDVTFNADTFGTWGGTYPSYGMDMAKQILASDKDKRKTSQSDKSVEPKKIVIFFTDGEPGDDTYSESAAGEALIKASEVKDMEGVEVYTVGLYPQSISNEALTFIKQLSSEYSTTINPVQAGSMQADKTYYVLNDGQYTAITTDYYGESSLGWWEDLGNGEYRRMSVKGGNAGAGEEYLYDGSNQVTGEDADTSKTYQSENGKPARYEYHWFDSEMNIVVPSGTVYSISQERRSGEYCMTTSSKAGLESVFLNLAAEIQKEDQSGGEEPAGGSTVVNYNSSNSVIRDVISSDFNKGDNLSVKLELVPASMVDGDVVETGADAVDVTEGQGYGYSWDGKSITVTGYDFGANSIYKNHDGNIMRVTITGLQPVNTGKVYSNVESQSGIYKTEDGAVGDRLFPYNNPSTTIATYTVDWNVDGTVVESDANLAFGTLPSYDGEEPVKEDDSQNTYTFVGWSADSGDETGVPADELPAVPENADEDNVITYYAIFRPAPIKYYDVHWMNGDEEVELDEDVKSGTYPEFNGAEPTKTPGSFYFIGWSTDPNFTTVTEATSDEVLAEKLYYGNKTVDELAGTGDSATLYAVFLAKEVGAKTVVVEYGTKNVIKHDAYGYNIVAANNGSFGLDYTGKDGNNASIGDFYYTPSMNRKGDDADLTALRNVSVADCYTDAPEDSSSTTITRYTVVPGSSIYLDDSLKEEPAQLNADSNTFDYAAALADKNVNDTETLGKGKIYTFTFSGSRIDVYCTTDGTANSVMASLKDASTGELALDKDGNKTKGILMANKFTNGTFYNTPTVSYQNLDPSKTYILSIKAMTDNYRLDGIRVYNPTDNTLNGEPNASYTKVRDIMIKGSDFTSNDDDENDMSFSGALFIDKFVGSEKPPIFQDYKDYGPKNEVYLANGQGIAIAVTSIPDFEKYSSPTIMLGLSSQKVGGNYGTVKVTNKNGVATINLGSSTEVYYEVNPKDGIILIKNVTGSNVLVSVSNIKVYGELKPADAAPSGMLTMSRARMLSYMSTFDSLPDVNTGSGETGETETPNDPGTDPNQGEGTDPDTPNDPGTDPNQGEGTDPDTPNDPGTDPNQGEGTDPDTPNDPGQDIEDEPDTPATPPADNTEEPTNSIFSRISSVVRSVVQAVQNTVSKLFKSIFRF